MEMEIQLYGVQPTVDGKYRYYANAKGCNVCFETDKKLDLGKTILVKYDTVHESRLSFLQWLSNVKE